LIFVYSLLMHFNINKLASFQLSFSFNMFIIFIDLFIDQFFSWNNFQWNTKKIFKMVIILKVLDYINYKFLYEEIIIILVLENFYLFGSWFFLLLVFKLRMVWWLVIYGLYLLCIFTLCALALDFITAFTLNNIIVTLMFTY